MDHAEEKKSSAVVEGVPGWSSYTLSNEERLRRVALACKLGQLASERDLDEEEKWLLWGVEEVLRLSRLGMTNASSEKSNTRMHENSGSTALEDFELPSWMSKTDLGAPLEALGTLYAKKGRIEYAMPLYPQVISLLLPPKANNVSMEDRCRESPVILTPPTQVDGEINGELRAAREKICNVELLVKGLKANAQKAAHRGFDGGECKVGEIQAMKRLPVAVPTYNVSPEDTTVDRATPVTYSRELALYEQNLWSFFESAEDCIWRVERRHERRGTQLEGGHHKNCTANARGPKASVGHEETRHL
ncbi:hypothetical protein CY34DRAFT_109328 [Suillus luteus UH-Slu-Lm8-n1]|uniref:Uncharacterized protein n=1 Tax=Suillus luteus UH-Slu-Lm8-n1 TaxID=930992 RepID=A0A0D0ART9_9AGAM|nr:hypothetical protein CY34DRAFT_109328 [Suillus luteus UH-Slu-Lm8-n1]